MQPEGGRQKGDGGASLGRLPGGQGAEMSLRGWIGVSKVKEGWKGIPAGVSILLRSS